MRAGVGSARVLMLGSFLCGLGTACIVGAGGTSEKLKVRVIEVVDKDGKTRIAMGAPDDGSATFAVNDAAGRARATVTVSADGSAGLLIGDGTEKKVFLGNTQGQGTVLTLSQGGASMEMMVLPSQGDPRVSGALTSLLIKDTHDKQRLALRSDDESTHLYFKDAQGRDRLSLGRSDGKLGNTRISLDREAASPVITLGDYDSEASVVLVGRTALKFSDDINDQPRKVIR